MGMVIRPLSLKQANAYVAELHRHNKPTVGHKFSIGCYKNDELVGVAIVGRPLARHLDDGETLEVLRVCSDGTRNVNSKLYGACVRIAKEMGYRTIYTYTLKSESGASLRGSGWIEDGEAGGGTWNVPSRPREIEVTNLFGTVQKYPIEKKIRWKQELRKGKNDG